MIISETIIITMAEQVLQPHIPGNKLTQKDSADSGGQFITPAAQGRVSS